MAVEATGNNDDDESSSDDVQLSEQNVLETATDIIKENGNEEGEREEGGRKLIWQIGRAHV